MKTKNIPVLHIGTTVARCGRQIKLPNIGIKQGKDESFYKSYAAENNFKLCLKCSEAIFRSKFAFLNTIKVSDDSVLIPKKDERSLSTTISAMKKKSPKRYIIEREGENYRVWRTK